MINPKAIANRDFLHELQFQTSRSSGPGGQNANKLETKVTLRFHLESSHVFNENEKLRLAYKWGNQLTTQGELIISCEEFRTQLRNKEAVVLKFRKAVELAFQIPKKRKKTKPTKSSVRKRLDNKKKHSDKKALRKPPKD